MRDRFLQLLSPPVRRRVGLAALAEKSADDLRELERAALLELQFVLEPPVGAHQRADGQAAVLVSELAPRGGGFAHG